MPRKQRFLTAIQDIAVNLVFVVMGERQTNRTLQEYQAIATTLPALKALVYDVNKQLKWMHKRSACSGIPLPEICRFNAGDKRYTFEAYPRSISYETLRRALIVAGLRRPRGRRNKTL
jgi:hypothetical protein